MKRITSRAVIGEFYKTLNAGTGARWINPISMYFTSDQDSEEYAWLGMAPTLQKWIGGRNAKGFRENGLTIENLHFEATIEVLVRMMRRDKSGQVMVRIRELARRANTHWASLLTTLIQNAESQACYDGQFFFDTDHEEGKSGTQSNDITTDISTLPAQVHGTAALPSPEEMQQAIIKSVVQMIGFKDDQGEPMNEDATSFLVMVPLSMYIPATNAISIPRVAGVSAQSDMPDNINIQIEANPRLTWTDKFATFRTDGEVKPMIRQEETGAIMKAKAEGSEFEFDNDAHQYGIDTWRNVGYGYWQHAVLNQLV